MRATVWIAMAAATMLVGGSDAAAQVRTAPDIKPSKGSDSGTGVNRHGIMTYRGRPQVPTFTIPQGGYGYYGGWSYGHYPRGRYYYRDSYYCSYCGSAFCDGGCHWGHGPLYLPPIVVDSGQRYGPRAAQRFLGVGGNNSSGAASQGSATRRSNAPAAAARETPRVSNPTARAQAWKFVEYGDRQFKKGDYRDALDRYRKAARQASEIADIHFRQAFALVGVTRYAEATEAVKRGLDLRPDWPNSGFVLEELYPSAQAKRDIFRQLHTQVDTSPNDAEARYMLAVMQHFDGQDAAAEVNFRQVIQLLGTAWHATAFLPSEPVANAEPQQDGGPQVNAPQQQQQGNAQPEAQLAPQRRRDGIGNLPPVSERSREEESSRVPPPLPPR